MIYFFLSRLLVAYTNDGHLKALQVIEFCPTTSYQINIQGDSYSIGEF